jgi:nucleoside-diphosphate-sugar epimerase
MSRYEKVAVTGAPGWLGTHLVKALVHGGRFGPLELEGTKVRCIVEPNADVTELNALGEAVEVVYADLRNADAVAGVCDGVDAVVHAAGIIHPKRIRELYQVNVDGTSHLLQDAMRAKAKRFIFVSSNSPAGVSKSHSHYMMENEAPRPYFNYGVSKLKAEELVQAGYQAGNIETSIIRPCWFYGPNQPARQSRFFNMIKSGRPIVFGDGNNLRSMSYTDNTVQGTLLALHSDKAVGNTYWITDREPYSFNQIVETVGRILEVEDLRPRHVPALSSALCRIVDWAFQGVGLYQQEFHVAGELSYSIAVSVDAAVADLGYNPEIALEEGMRRSIAWCRANGQDV